MNERPILFQGEMVRALLAGTKTQTRRVCKRAQLQGLTQVVEVPDPHERDQVYNRSHFGDEDGEVTFASPYGGVGDRLWVRETWQGPLLEAFESDADSEEMNPSRIHQHRNPAHCQYAADGGPAPEFMDADDNLQPGSGFGLADTTHFHAVDPINSYFSLSEAINGAGSVEANPWVWAVTLARINGATP